ncbi:LacI family transcriptional regulator [Ilyomonas limi]|uniref:LacI family transcriptional regulator n=1 Tax=Ilyomonas limi TaxID=2575867 RepID=A0A4V5UTV3_9BACT|nr:LacI family DNA-binding transcriptional regulator [Ilyomonas limi]TKK66613.1 LacI family transcriptional regulator [Ilyomonas limi]
MNQDREITIYDIAGQLGVSPATVSRALKNNPSISAFTRSKVVNLAAELGYRHNTFASNLRTQRTNIIGVIVHELNSNFITSAIAGIEKAATKANYTIIIGHSSESAVKEVAAAKNLFHKRVDGLIASLAYDTTDLSHFNSFIEKNIPVIFFDRVDERSNSTKVIINNYKAGYTATQHLIEQGCKRIVHVTGNLIRNVYAERLAGYQQALADNNITLHEDYVITNDLSEEASVQAAKKILHMHPLPDGIFVAKDISAALCMQTLKDAGIRIPQDIAVAGFNNDAVSRVTDPKLTTINYNGFTMGEVAGQKLIDHLNGVTDLNITSTITLKSELIIRASSLKKGKG